MHRFILGADVMACCVIGLFFLRFWRRTRDRLFFYFSMAFWVLGFNWFMLAFANQDEPQTALYAVRLVAFGLIILGIWGKNREKT